MAILELLASGASGGLLGVVGSGINRAIGYFERKQAHEMNLELAHIEAVQSDKKQSHEIAMQQSNNTHVQKLHELNREARAQETEQEIAIMSQKGSWQGLNASIDNQTKSVAKSSQWVVDVQAGTRPLMTLLLWIMVMVIFIISEPTRAEIVAAVIFSASLATSWWFGDRAGLKHPKIGGAAK